MTVRLRRRLGNFLALQLVGELLEARELNTVAPDLSDGGNPSELVAPAAVTSATISEVTIRVDDQLVSITPGATLALKVGQLIAVQGVRFQLDGAAQADDQFALEGYLRQLTVSGRSRISDDYNYQDGRFGSGLSLNEGASSGEHQGLTGAWQATTGQTALSLVLMRYADDVPAGLPLARIVIQLQVTQRTDKVDFQIAQGKVDKAQLDRTTTITGAWVNTTKGTFRNYAEVNVYHESDLLAPVWVGTLSGVSVNGGRVSGEFTNDRADDAFAERWVPNRSGRYVVRFYADPENVWKETNERNNTREIVVKISPQQADIAFATNATNPTHHRKKR